MYKFVILKIRKLFFPIIFSIFIILLLIFSKDCFFSAKSGLLLWVNSVVPSLLPFFIATELLSYTNITSILGKLLNKFMKPLFNIPGEGSIALILGTISGYPVGAKIVVNLKEQGILNTDECERLISFTNNSGPLFIVGTVGISLFGDTATGFLLLITHILASITVGILFRWWKTNKSYANNNFTNYKSSTKQVHLSNLGLVLSNSITSAISTVVMIGGFIVLFSVILSIFKNSYILYILSRMLNPFLSIINISTNYSSGIIQGLIELTNGVYTISTIINKTISINILICAFLLGFGGISIAFQVLSITSKSKISFKPYIIGKLLQACFATFYTYIALNCFPFLNLNL